MKHICYEMPQRNCLYWLDFCWKIKEFDYIELFNSPVLRLILRLLQCTLRIYFIQFKIDCEALDVKLGRR